jgi:hypothetical protein
MRRVQIEGRTRHLLNLYHCHLDQGVYDHLQTVPALATIPAGRLVPATARAVS